MHPGNAQTGCSTQWRKQQSRPWGRLNDAHEVHRSRAKEPTCAHGSPFLHPDQVATTGQVSHIQSEEQTAWATDCRVVQHNSPSLVQHMDGDRPFTAGAEGDEQLSGREQFGEVIAIIADGHKRSWRARAAGSGGQLRKLGVLRMYGKHAACSGEQGGQEEGRSSGVPHAGLVVGCGRKATPSTYRQDEPKMMNAARGKG